jgi:uncharacterized protein (UPF0261 family)
VGAFHDPEANKAWLEGLKSTLPDTATLLEVPFHINEPGFADAAVDWLVKNLKSEVVSNENV